MISKLVGIVSKQNTKTKIWWIKLGLSLVLSNVLFFMLFSGPAQEPANQDSLLKLVDVQLTATLMTPFQEGKRVLLVHRPSRLRVEGVLRSTQENGVTVATTEESAIRLLQQENWEVIPYLKDFKFRQVTRGEGYEIVY